MVRNHTVYYNELETRVRLSKRRARAGGVPQALTRLVVTHRPLSATEHRMLRLRERQLEPQQVSLRILIRQQVFWCAFLDETRPSRWRATGVYQTRHHSQTAQCHRTKNAEADIEATGASTGNLTEQ